jgi:catechol 2,3-dioxygenase
MSIDPQTQIGAVTLRVSDLDRSLAFYTNVLGLQSQGGDGGGATLGAGSTPLVTLIESPGARPKPRRATGLYHFAILVPSRLELARSLARLVQAGGQEPGASDHGVSEALYLSDPDGNGIEVYRDRARSEWPLHNGALDMVIAPLNLTALVAQASEGGAIPRTLDPATRIGHVHLHVSDLAEAEAFYTGALGFDVMQRMADSALFISAGGYHHHLGLNTWAGVGAPIPPAGSAGLEHFVVTLPDAGALSALRAQLARRGVRAESHDNGWLVRDPSGNAMLLTSA